MVLSTDTAPLFSETIDALPRITHTFPGMYLANTEIPWEYIAILPLILILCTARLFLQLKALNMNPDHKRDIEPAKSIGWNEISEKTK